METNSKTAVRKLIHILGIPAFSLTLSEPRNLKKTLKLASSIFSPSYQQEQRKQPFAGGYQRLTHQWFHPPLLLYLRQDYLSESCRRLSRIDGKILTFCPVCAPRRPVIYATAWPDRGGYIRQSIPLSCSQYVLDHYYQNRDSKLKALAC